MSIEDNIIPIAEMSDWRLAQIIDLFEDNVEDIRFNEYRMESRRVAGMPIDDPYYLEIIAENQALEANTAEIEMLLRDKGVRPHAIEEYRRVGLAKGNAYIRKERDTDQTSQRQKLVVARNTVEHCSE